MTDNSVSLEISLVAEDAASAAVESASWMAEDFSPWQARGAAGCS